ncbi:DUF5008 domain-containing protein [Arachidicoccus sp.]|uniref:DUF5008 domain-containing protein n=1 Tax=Arachidicoccus sp. TaxID=1872624 RepID=UPI003D21E760
MFTIFKTKTFVAVSLILLTGFGIFGMYSCKKSDGLASDPYNKKVQPLIKFLDEDPSPVSGVAGAKVTFYIDGLQGKDTSSFQVFINQERAAIVSLQDTALMVIIPQTASSGAISILIDGQNYFGPIFQVDGYVRIDPTFSVGTGINSGGAIYDIYQNSDNTFFLTGSFNNYNGQATTTQPINDIVKISNAGAYINSTKAGTGIVGGDIASMVYVSGQNCLGGSYNYYYNLSNINNITRISNTGQLDTVSVNLINLDLDNHPEDDTAYLPSFNGGVNGVVNHLYYDGTGIVAIGSFYQYLDYYYLRSTKAGYVQDRYNVTQFVRMTTDGTLDSSYNINPATGLGYSATNGYINSSIQLSNGKIIIAGSFTSFNGAHAGHIAMLDDDGQMDATFNAGQAGADDMVSKVTYNPNTHKIMLIGSFKNYNGVPAAGVVMLNEDGSIDNTFHIGSFVGGSAGFAIELSNGKVLVTGNFIGYNGVYRQGMLFLNPDGSMAEGYNNMGSFVGQVEKAYESPTAFGTFGVILVGSFSLVDNQSVNGIVKLEVQ